MIGCVNRFAPRVGLARTTTALGVPYFDVALDGSGNSLYGRVSGFDAGHGTACYCCGWDQENWDMLSREEGVSGCAALVAVTPDAPATLALPGLAESVAGLSVIQAIRFLLGCEPERVLGREWRLNLSAGRLSDTGLSPDPRCRLGHRPWPIVELGQRPAELTVAALFEQAAARLGATSPWAPPTSLWCSKRVVSDARARRSRPACGVAYRGRHACQGALVPLVTGLRPWFCRSEVIHLLDRTWAELGLVPGGAVLAVRGGLAEVVFLFEEDQSATETGPKRDHAGHCHATASRLTNGYGHDQPTRDGA